jgi:UDP-N-acetylmuramate--alanine ligase
MTALPLNIDTLHFVGIGGIGMSGIAEILHNLGYAVQGSDVAENANVLRLRTLGIPVTIGHNAENLASCSAVIVSSAIAGDNPEVEAARQRFIPVVRRAEMLAELMRLKWSIAVGGTHGKTTTTSLIAHLLDTAGLDPTVINGGIINAYGTNARSGAGDWMVVEADESDGTFAKLPATIAVVTNIDPEHMTHYGSFDDLRAAFATFVENVPFYGFGVLCLDHPEVQTLIPQLLDRRLLTYGFNRQADVQAIDVGPESAGMRFTAVIGPRVRGGELTLERLHLPMFGRHNVQNAVAAITVASELEIAPTHIRRGLSTFQGVERRFTITGEAGGVVVVDDYGHHPVEIEAVLTAARDIAKGRVIAVVQPHRFSRLHDLFEDFCTCFNTADCVVIADVYAAGETPIPGADRDGLVAGIRARGHRDVRALQSAGHLPGLIGELAAPGDMVICLGAGSITQWAQALPDALADQVVRRAGNER